MTERPFNICALIIAQSGSKGLYKKNSILIGSKPLIEYTIEAAIGAKSISNVYLSTDDPEILEKYNGYKGLKLIKLPNSLAYDDISIKDIVKHAVKKIKEDRPDLIALLSPTAPFREAKHIDEAIRFSASLPRHDSVVSVSRVRLLPYGGLMLDDQNAVIPLLNNAFKYINKQEQPPMYRLNRAIWLVKPERIGMLNGLLMSGKSYGFIMDEISSVDIDTQLDVIVSEAVLSFKKKRVSWSERGRHNAQRFYVNDDPCAGILRNIYDVAAYKRHLGRYRIFLKRVKPTDSVLDIACGSGYGSEILASKARMVRGVDRDAKTIEYAIRNHRRFNMRFDVSSIESFDPNERFNKIVSVETIEHLAEPEKFLGRAKEWLKPGGEIWITCPLSEDSSALNENPFHISSLTHASLKAMMENHFSEVRIFSLSGKAFKIDTLNNKTTYVIAKGAEPIK